MISISSPLMKSMMPMANSFRSWVLSAGASLLPATPRASVSLRKSGACDRHRDGAGIGQDRPMPLRETPVKFSLQVCSCRERPSPRRCSSSCISSAVGVLQRAHHAEAEELRVGMIPDALGKLRILDLPGRFGSAPRGAAQLRRRHRRPTSRRGRNAGYGFGRLVPGIWPAATSYRNRDAY